MISFNSQTCLTSGEEVINPLNAKLNPICHLLALAGAHHILHVSRVRVKYCFKFLSRNCWYCGSDEGATACTIAACMVTLNQSSDICTEKGGHVWMYVAQRTDWILSGTEWHVSNMLCWKRGEMLVNHICIFAVVEKMWSQKMSAFSQNSGARTHSCKGRVYCSSSG